MSFNVAGSSTRVPNIPPSDLSLSDIPTVKELNTPEKLSGFLKGRLKNLDTHINTLTAQEVDGEAFLEITQEDLTNLGIPLGPAKKILKLINEIKGGEQSFFSVIFANNTEYLLILVLSFLLLIVKPAQKTFALL
jgi:hypothetical protein